MANEAPIFLEFQLGNQKTWQVPLAESWLLLGWAHAVLPVEAEAAPQLGRACCSCL